MTSPRGCREAKPPSWPQGNGENIRSMEWENHEHVNKTRPNAIDYGKHDEEQLAIHV